MKKILIITAYNPASFENLNHQLLNLAQENHSNIKVRNLYELHDKGFNIEEEQVQVMLADTVIFQFPVFNDLVSKLIPKYFQDVFEPGFGFSADESHLSASKEVGLISVIEGEKLSQELCNGTLLKPVEVIINTCDWKLSGTLEIIFSDPYAMCKVSEKGTKDLKRTGQDKIELYAEFLERLAQEELQPMD